MKFLNWMTALIITLLSFQLMAADQNKRVAVFNKSMTFDLLAQNLKAVFTTSEDARQIDLHFSKVNEIAKKWVWRLEPRLDQVALRINGRVQSVFKVNADNPNELIINGQKLTITQGMSYLSYSKEVQRLIAKKQARLDSLFFQEAQAVAQIPIFVAFGALIGGFAIGYQEGKKQCHTEPNCPHKTCARKGQWGSMYGNGAASSSVATTTTTSTAQTSKQRDLACRKQTWLRLPPRTLRFNSTEMHITATKNWLEPNKCNTRAHDRNSILIARNSEMPCFVDVPSCTAVKTGNRKRAFDKHLKEHEARAICETIAAYKACMGGAVIQQVQQVQTTTTVTEETVETVDTPWGGLVPDVCPKGAGNCDEKEQGSGR